MGSERIHTYCAQSKSRCGVIATVEDGVLKRIEPDRQHPNGCICVKGAAAPEMVYAPDRLKYPMKRTRPKGDPDPGWERISWDEALEIAARRLLEIREAFGAEAVVFGRPAAGGSPSNDYVPWLMRLAQGFGSPNFMTTGHICNWHKDDGSRYTYGSALPAPDFEETRCILLWGHNPKVSWPAHAARIRRARKRGARLIVVDPRRAGFAEEADVWLRVRPGADGALLLSMIHVFLEEGLYDRDFVRTWTNGFLLVRSDTGQPLTQADITPGGAAHAYAAWDANAGGPAIYRPGSGFAAEDVQPALEGSYSIGLCNGGSVECRPSLDLLKRLAAQYAPERSEEITWVPAGEVRRAARMFAQQTPSCYYTYVGLGEHTNAMQSNRALCILYALTGQYDAPGSNVLFPKPPQNPVRGDELLPREQGRIRLGRAERPLGPPAGKSVRANDVYRAVLDGTPYPVKALVLFGGNPLVSNSNPLLGRRALEALDFYVHVDVYHNPGSHLADLVLPASTAWESDMVKAGFEMGESTSTWVQWRQAAVAPLHESRPDLRVIFDLACRLGLGEQFWQGDIEAAFDHWLAPSGITVKELREHPVGIRVPVPLRHRKYAEVDPRTGARRGFDTATRLVEIFSIPFARHGYAALPEYEEPAVGPYSRPDLSEAFPLVLTSSKLLQFCHSQHRNIASLRRAVPDPFVEIHPETARLCAVEDGDWVALESPSGMVRVRARYNPDLHPRVVCTQHGWWQDCPPLGLPGYDPLQADGANVNLLIADDQADPISGSLPHRSYLCRVRPWQAALAQGTGD